MFTLLRSWGFSVETERGKSRAICDWLVALLQRVVHPMDSKSNFDFTTKYIKPPLDFRFVVIRVLAQTLVCFRVKKHKNKTGFMFTSHLSNSMNVDRTKLFKLG